MNSPGECDKLPPQNVPIEQGLIGAIMIDESVIDDVFSIVAIDDFYARDHQLIASAVKHIHDEGKRVDIGTVEEELKRRGQADKVGGFLGLAEYVNAIAFSALAVEHAHIVRSHSEARRVIEYAQELLKVGYAGQFNGEQMIALAEKGALGLASERRKSGSVIVSDATENALERILRRKRGEMTGTPTGLQAYDDMMDGLQPGQVTVVAARPSMGKTALVLNWAEFIAADFGVPTYFATLEMSADEIGERVLASRSRINANRLKTGDIGETEVAELRGVIAGLKRQGGLYIDDSSCQTVSQIVSAARRHQSRDGVGVVVIDYIQLIETEAGTGRNSRQELVSMVSRRLKLLAKSLKLPVIALSQLNRGCELREDKRPRMSDLRESGSIEQDADNVVLVHRPSYYDPNDQPGIAELIIAKNRNGPTGTVKAAWLGHLMRFENLVEAPEPTANHPNF